MGLLRSRGGDSSKMRGPMRPKLEEAIRILTQQQNALNIKLSRIRHYDRVLFEKVVQSYQNRDMSRAKIYANELSEVRKLIKAITTASLVLEQISIRLTTVKEYGDFARDLSVVKPSLNFISGSIPTIMSESRDSFSRLNEIMDGLMVNAACLEETRGGMAAIEGSEEILRDAQKRAEMELDRTLPKLPEFDAVQKRVLRERESGLEGLNL